MINEMTVEYGGKVIKGLLYIPEISEKKFPLVVCCHGFGSKYEWMQEYAGEFCDAGCVAAIFDFCGGSQEERRSSGSSLDLSVVSEAEDTKAVLEYCKDLDFVDGEKVFLLGESMGGMVATMTACENPEAFKGLMLLYPGYSMPDMAKRLYPDKNSIPRVCKTSRMDVGAKYYRDLYDIDVWSMIEQFKNPVYIIHGDADSVVPIEYSKKAVEIFDNALLTVFSGREHGFEGDDIKSAAECFTEFLKELI